MKIRKDKKVSLCYYEGSFKPVELTERVSSLPSVAKTYSGNLYYRTGLFYHMRDWFCSVCYEPVKILGYEFFIICSIYGIMNQGVRASQLTQIFNTYLFYLESQV